MARRWMACACVVVAAALAWAPSATADGGVNIAPGPCNSVNLFVDTDEQQDDIFDNFVIGTDTTLQWVRSDDINTWFEYTVKVSSIDCSASGTSSGASSQSKETETSHERTNDVVDEVIAGGEVHERSNADISHHSEVIGHLGLARVAPVRSMPSMAETRTLVPGRYSTRLAVAFKLRHHRAWHRAGKSRRFEFDVVCRVQSSVGCL
jgi:hypothetical protein